MAAEVALAFLDFEQAMTVYSKGAYGDAAPLFSKAAVQLRAHGQPWAVWAEYYLAVCWYHAGRAAEATARFRSLASETRTEWPVFQAHLDWMIGLSSYVRGRYEEAAVAYERARLIFLASAEPENVGAMETFLARVYQTTGREDDAWAARYRSLSVLPAISSIKRVVNILVAAIDGALSIGSLHAALSFQQELLVRTRAAEDPLYFLLALRRGTEIAARLGDRKHRDELLAECEQALQAIEDPGIRENARIDLSLLQGRLWGGERPALVAQRLNEALELARRRDHRLRVPAILHAAGRASVAAGDSEAAKSFFLAARDEAAHQRRNLPPQRWSAHLEATAAISENLIRPDDQNGEPDAQTFRWSEERRRAALLAGVAEFLDDTRGEVLLRTPAEPLTIEEAVRRTPSETAVVVLDVGTNDTLVWAIGNRGWHGQRHPVGADWIADRVQRFRAGFEPAAGAELASLIVDSISVTASDARRVVVVPDGPFWDLPLEALPIGDDELLVDRLSVVLSPSVADALKPRPTLDPEPRMIIVADPKFSPGAGVERVRGGEALAAQLANIAADFHLLTQESATVGALEAALPADVVHLSTHLVLDPRVPVRSRLLLAPSTESDGSVGLPRLVSAGLDVVDLLVLGACRSSRPLRSDGLGPSLASTFLALGVPAVLAATNDIDDAVAAQFLHAFHRHLANSRDPVAALDQARSELRENPTTRHPRHWAGITYLGGVR